MKKIILIYILIIMLFSTSAFAWDDIQTHPKITRIAIEESALTMSDFLIKQLKLEPGKEITDWKDPYSVIPISSLSLTFREWIELGSEEEDSPLCRASNHFHNPLEAWVVAGLSDTLVPVNWWCWGFGLGDYPREKIQSNLVWATGYVSKNNLNNDEIREFNKWDWESAREYFYSYLTGKNLEYAPNFSEEEIRNRHLARTFRALGYVLHLLEDTAVPAHVRNDWSWGHTYLVTDEDKIFKTWVGNRFEEYVKLNTKDGEWFDMQIIGSNLIGPSLTDFWDTDQYHGSLYDGQSNPIDFNKLGLSEYTNINYVSEFTVFTEDWYNHTDESKWIHFFPYPKESSIRAKDTPEEVLLENGETRLVCYYEKFTDGEIIDHFAVENYFGEELKSVHDLDPNAEVKTLAYMLDENCYNDYAENLIPRAIGYSSDLIDYFFRGKIDLVPDTETGYGYVIENNSSETMTGLFELYYDKIVGKDGNNKDIINRVPVLTSFGTPFVHWTSIPANNKSDNVLSFNMPEDAATPGEYTLVFNGKLGKETKAVVGKVLTLEESKRFLDITLPSDGYYARTDKHPYYQDTQDPRYTNEPGTKGFDKIIVNVKNIAPAHVEMTGGTVKLAVIYRLGSGDQFRNPQAATSYGFYILNKEITVAGGIPRDTPIRLEFDLTGTEVPLWATDIYLNLTYNGTLSLGSGYQGDLGDPGEDIETACSGFKDIAEPTPIDVLNLMDVICINDGNGPLLYDAGSNAALEIVDTDEDGDADEWDIYVHDIRDMTLEFSYTCSEPECKYSIPYLAAGEYQRLFVLSDYEGEKNVYGGDYFTLAVDPADTRYHNNSYFRFVNRYHGVKNQSEFGEFPECDGSTYCWKRTITSFYGPIRGLYVLKALIKVNDGYPGDADPLTELTCSYRDQ